MPNFWSALSSAYSHSVSPNTSPCRLNRHPVMFAVRQTHQLTKLPRMAVVMAAAIFWFCQNSPSNNIHGCILFDDGSRSLYLPNLLPVLHIMLYWLFCRPVGNSLARQQEKESDTIYPAVCSAIFSLQSSSFGSCCFPPFRNDMRNGTQYASFR